MKTYYSHELNINDLLKKARSRIKPDTRFIEKLKEKYIKHETEKVFKKIRRN